MEFKLQICAVFADIHTKQTFSVTSPEINWLRHHGHPPHDFRLVTDVMRTRPHNLTRQPRRLCSHPTSRNLYISSPAFGCTMRQKREQRRYTYTQPPPTPRSRLCLVSLAWSMLCRNQHTRTHTRKYARGLAPSMQPQAGYYGSHGDFRITVRRKPGKRPPAGPRLASRERLLINNRRCWEPQCSRHRLTTGRARRAPWP